jgi:hypothetical protein
MKEKIVEMTAKELRNYLTRAVRKEIAKRLLKENDDFIGSEDSKEDINFDHEKEKAKQELIRLLIDRTGQGSAYKLDISDEFLDFISKHAEKYNLENLKYVKSLEDLAEKIISAYSNVSSSDRWRRAKKYADDLVTKFIVQKGLSKYEYRKAKSEEEKNKAFKGKEEEFMEYINRTLTSYAKRYRKSKDFVFNKFVEFLKDQYPSVIRRTDDNITAITVYVDFMSNTPPVNRSVQTDVRAFLDIFQIKKGIEDIENELKKPEPEEEEEEQSIEYAKVTQVDGSKLREIASALGVTEKAVNDILAAIPPGKVKAIYDVLYNAVTRGNAGEAKRTLESYDAIAQRAIRMAVKEYIMLIEDAIDNIPDPDGNLTATDLALKIEEEGLYDGVTQQEIQNEMIGLNRIAEIVNDPKYADNDLWKDLVGEMLRLDLTKKVVVKSGDTRISSPNVFKSFQNLVAKTVGMIDPASFKKDGAGRPNAAIKARMDKAQAAASEIGYQGKIKIGDIESKINKSTRKK